MICPKDGIYQEAGDDENSHDGFYRCRLIALLAAADGGFNRPPTMDWPLDASKDLEKERASAFHHPG